jgi:twitching motility protein PilT
MDPADRILGELALKNTLLTREQVSECVRTARKEDGQRNLAEIARDLGWLAPGDVEWLVQQRDQSLAQRRLVPGGPQDVPAGPPPQVALPAPPVIVVAAPPESEIDEADAPQASPVRHSLPPRPKNPAMHSRRVSSRAVVMSRNVSDPNVDDPTKPPYLLRALHFAVKHGASDLHVHSGAPLMGRGAGRLMPFQGQKAMSPEMTEKAIAQILTDEQWEKLAADGEVDFPLELPRIGRFRANAYRQHRGLDVVFRILPPDPPRLEQLGLPSSLARLVDFRTGMVLCTGPAGCGKSTTLAALLGTLIQAREEHVLTIEDPVEHVYPPGRALVNQRQVRDHTSSFARALRAALREDPDVIAITELRDRETIGLAISAAETGHLVLGTLHTGNAVQTVNRIVSSFPADEQEQVRAMLAESLRAVVSQRLVPKASGKGRVPAIELMMVTHAVSNLIREDKTHQLPSVMQTGKAAGMITLDDSLDELLRAQVIERETARRFAVRKERFG